MEANKGEFLMAEPIQAIYDELRSVAAALEGLASQADGVHSTISANRDALSGEWMGWGYESFSEEMDGEIIPGLKKLANALRTASTTTTQIATQFETTESEEASKISAISAPTTLTV
ncbi:MAG: WXG100 family type VII secretion target [Bacteroidota bacterium]